MRSVGVFGFEDENMGQCDPRYTSVSVDELYSQKR